MVKNKKERSKFSRNIIKYRKARGLTQIDLAKRSGLSERMIAYYENNVSNPPINNVIAIADAIDVSIYDLIESNNKKHLDIFEDIDMRTLKKIMLIKNLSKKDRVTIYNMIDAMLGKNKL